MITSYAVMMVLFCRNAQLPLLHVMHVTQIADAVDVVRVE